MILKNKQVKISKLGEEKIFMSGTKYWLLEWAEINNERFINGDEIAYFDEYKNEYCNGIIQKILAIETGCVEVITNTGIGRLDLEEIEHTAG